MALGLFAHFQGIFATNTLKRRTPSGAVQQFTNSRGAQIVNKKEVVFRRPLKQSHRSTQKDLAEAPVKWQRTLLQVE